MISLNLALAPVAKGRPRFGRGKVYTPTETVGFERLVRSLAQVLYEGPPMKGPLKLTAKFFVKAPKRPKYPEPAVKPDFDNFLKSLTDSLNGVLWEDDAQICRLGEGSGKFYGDPRIEIRVERIERLEREVKITGMDASNRS